MEKTYVNIINYNINSSNVKAVSFVNMVGEKQYVLYAMAVIFVFTKNNVICVLHVPHPVPVKTASPSPSSVPNGNPTVSAVTVF